MQSSQCIKYGECSSTRFKPDELPEYLLYQPLNFSSDGETVVEFQFSERPKNSDFRDHILRMFLQRRSSLPYVPAFSTFSRECGPHILSLTRHNHPPHKLVVKLWYDITLSDGLLGPICLLREVSKQCKLSEGMRERMSFLVICLQ